MHRDFSLLGRVLLAFVTVAAFAAPAAGQSGQSEPPPEEFFFEDLVAVAPEDFPDIDFPEGFDPAVHEIEYDPFVGLFINKATDLGFDPTVGVIFELFGPQMWSADTLEPIAPGDIGIPADVPLPGPSGEPAVTPGPQPEAQADGPGPGRRTEFWDEDSVLRAHYVDGDQVADLGEYAFAGEQLPDGAVAEAFQFVAYEIALLFELGAFDRTRAWYETFEAIHAEFDLESTDRATLLATYRAVDEQLADRSALFGQILTADEFFVQWIVQPLPPGFFDQMARGEWAFMTGYEYAAGLLRLTATGATLNVGADGVPDVSVEAALAQAIAALEIQEDLNRLLSLELDEMRDAVAALSNAGVGLSSPRATGGGNDAILYSLIAAALVIALLGLVLAFRRRKDGPDTVRLDANETVAAAQLLAGAKNEAEIVRVLDRVADRLVGTPVTLFHTVTDGLRQSGSQAIVTGSDLRRVVDTGQRVVAVLYDDPSFPGRDRAVVALPVIHGGTVQALLVAHRPADESFTDDDRRKLEPIAPALGGALERAAELGTMSKLAMIDGLTSLGNRRRLDGDLETTLASAVAGDMLLGFAMIDVDHFKTFNDTHGHSAGDEVLRQVAATIAGCVRDSDVVYRYGGEEFSVLLPGASPEEAAMVAERVRASVAAAAFAGEETQPGGHLTVSVGVATLATGGPEDLRDRADAALYDAKAAGRNQVAFG